MKLNEVLLELRSPQERAAFARQYGTPPLILNGVNAKNLKVY